MLRTALLIGLGGFVGANLRYWLGGWIAQKIGVLFPIETMLINLSGSFLLGLFMTLALHYTWSPEWRQVDCDWLYRLVHDLLHLRVREFAPAPRGRVGQGGAESVWQPRAGTNRCVSGRRARTPTDWRDRTVRIEGQAKLLRIYIGETDRWHGQPLYMAILLKAREMGLAGGTVFRGIAGYGANSVIHTANILRLSEDLPVVIEIVDADEKIQAFLPVLDEMVKEGLILLREVEVIKYAGNRG
jgi:PII-like signaling protein